MTASGAHHRAELAAIERVLTDLAERLGAIAGDEKGSAAGEQLAAELFAVEGQLRSGVRRLSAVVRRLR